MSLSSTRRKPESQLYMVRTLQRMSCLNRIKHEHGTIELRLERACLRPNGLCIALSVGATKQDFLFLMILLSARRLSRSGT